MTKAEFIDWLKHELNIRSWTQAEFARQTKLSPAQITRLLSGERGVGENGLKAISHALRYPPELVFEKAGLLPQKQELSPLKRALIHQIETDDILPDGDLQMIMTFLDLRRDYYEKNPQSKPAK